MLTREQLRGLANIEMDLLEEYDYDCSPSGIMNGLYVWNENKSHLRNILRKHPNWNEELQLIQFDTDFGREVDKKAIDNFARWMVFSANGDYTDDKEVIKFSKFINSQSSHILDELEADYLNTEFPDLRARVGQKVTKIVNKFCKAHGMELCEVWGNNYNQAYAKYCDAITPLKIKRHTIISINPIDYLTMSFGNSWSSCHTIDKKNRRGMPNNYSGCYSSGTMSYMLDKTSVVFYTIDASYNGDRPYLQPKINRNMFHIGSTGEQDVLVQARLYPQTCDTDNGLYKDFRMIMQKVIADCIGVSNLWKNSKGTEVCESFVRSRGTHYADYEQFPTCNVSILSENFKTWEPERGDKITVGHDPICPNCGDDHGEEDNICCEDCNDSNRSCCYSCGDRHDEDDLYYSERTGEYYCSDCCFTCYDCDEVFPNRNSNEAYHNGREVYVCDECLDDYISCDDCGDYFYYDDVTRTVEENYYCGDCIDNNAKYIDGDYYEEYDVCANCSEAVPEVDSIYDEKSDEYYCKDCYEAIVEDRETA